MDACLGGTATISSDGDQYGLEFRSDRSGTATCPISRDEAEKLIWACMAENSTQRSQYWKDRNEGGCQLNNERWITSDIGSYDDQLHRGVYDYLQQRIADVDLSAIPLQDEESHRGNDLP